MSERLASWFRLAEHGTTVRTEIFAGLTTFLTMAYIIFLQPAVLSGKLVGQETGIDFGAVTTATCVSAALATLIMGLWARLPIALAPGMGENFFFVMTAIPAAATLGYAEPWRAALGAVFVAGLLFFGLSLLGLRQHLIDAVSPSLKSAMTAGIGLFIAFLGLQNAGVISAAPGTMVKLNAEWLSPDRLVFGVSLCVTVALLARGVRGAVLGGIVAAGLVTVAGRLVVPLLPTDWQAAPAVAESQLLTRFEWAQGIVAPPPSMAPTLLKMDVTAALSLGMLPLILVFLFMDLFDTMGTLIGVTEQAGLTKEGQIPRAKQALLADATGTLAGACMGTSTVTSFIESAAGVQQGGRTGLTAVTAAMLFLAALFFSPLIAMVASYPPMTAAALVVVGALMMPTVARVVWDDATEAIPAFLILLGMPLTMSVGDGLALGLVAYPVVKLLSRRGREVSWVLYVLGVALALYFVLVRAQLG